MLKWIILFRCVKNGCSLQNWSNRNRFFLCKSSSSWGMTSMTRWIQKFSRGTDSSHGWSHWKLLAVPSTATSETWAWHPNKICAVVWWCYKQQDQGSQQSRFSAFYSLDQLLSQESKFCTPAIAKKTEHRVQWMGGSNWVPKVEPQRSKYNLLAERFGMSFGPFLGDSINPSAWMFDFLQPFELKIGCILHLQAGNQHQFHAMRQDISLEEFLPEVFWKPWNNKG